MNFWKTYIGSFWFLGIFAFINLILVWTHAPESFNLSVWLVTSFLSAILAFSLMCFWQNQQKFSKIYFVSFHLLASLIFFFFFKNHFHSYVLEDSWLYFYYPLIWIFLSIFLASWLAAMWKDQKYLWKRNANIASSFWNGIFFALLISIGVLLVIFSVDLLFWNNIYKWGFWIKIYLSIFVATFFSITWYYFLKNFEQKNYFLETPPNGSEKSPDTKSFLKLYFTFILLFFIFWATNILLMLQKWSVQPWLGYAIVIYLILWLWYYSMDFPWKNKINITFWLIALWFWGFLIYATKIRIGYHGRSISRYWAILLAWVCIILAFSQIIFKNLKIFIALIYFTILFWFFSPLNWLNISQKDQIERIENILKKEWILVDWNLIEPKKSLSNEKRADLLLRIQNYIYNYWSKGLLPWLKTWNAASVWDAINDFSEITWIKRWFESYKTQEEQLINTSRPYDIFKSYEFDSSDFWSVQGYEMAFRFKATTENPSSKYNSNSIRLLWNQIRVFYNQKVYNLDLKGYLNSISQIKEEKNIIPSYSIAVGEYYFTIVFSNLQINTNQNIIDSVDSMIFVKKI